jgi:hypothetical protein
MFAPIIESGPALIVVRRRAGSKPTGRLELKRPAGYEDAQDFVLDQLARNTALIPFPILMDGHLT